MSVIVQKYGGTSVADANRIRIVAERVAAARRDGHDVVVVVSAMGDTTDELMAMAHELTPMPNPRELDLLLTAGERIAMSLLAVAINAAGFPAASYTGSQAGIITDTAHGQAKIIDIRPGRILEAISKGSIVIVAGFQGVSTAYDVTTLGRGGSDTTAVALAAALSADFCEIYTDVPGVFTADPRVVPEASKLHAVSYEEMLELASSGARVLQLRAVEYARTHGVRVHVRSSFTDEPGTWVTEEDVRMEQAMISGVASDDSEAKVTLEGVPDRPGVAAAVFAAMARDGVPVDMIVQNVARDGRTDISFLVPEPDLSRLTSSMDRLVREVGALGFGADRDVAKISLVGAGIRSHPEVLAGMFEALAAEDINLQMISTSSIRISCVIQAADADRAVRAVHRRFAISEEAGPRERHPEGAPPREDVP
ncbi:MAG: aspartate kinase [Actinobacteria bacterium]|nr:aspartate kinase [Actinomycetota bacterium]